MSKYTYKELQSMTREDFIEHFPQPLKIHRRRGIEVNGAEVTREIIYASLELDWIKKKKDRQVKEFWYQVKPIIIRALGARGHRFYPNFLDTLSSEVKKGKLNYNDLSIKDSITLRDYREEIKNAMCWSNIILFIEKNAVYQYLEPLKKFFNINILSGSGWTNTSAIEALRMELKEHGVDDPIEIYALTDYDPAGFGIGRDFRDRSRELRIRVKSYKRLGINPGHLSQKEIHSQKYEIKFDPDEDNEQYNEKAWLDRYGIDGKYGLEIEAISGQRGGGKRLYRLVGKELMKYLDRKDRIYEITDEMWENAYQNALPKLERDWSIKKTGDEPDYFLMGEEYLEKKQEIERQIEKVKKPFLEKKRRIRERWDEWYSSSLHAEAIPEELSQVKAKLRKLRHKKDKLEQRKRELRDHKANKAAEECRDVTYKQDQATAPLYDELDDLTEREKKSRKLVKEKITYFGENVMDTLDRDSYNMGYPEGIFDTAIEQGWDIYKFKRQADDSNLIEDLEERYEQKLYEEGPWSGSVPTTQI